MLIWVLLGFIAMIEIENQFFTDVCYVQHGTFLAVLVQNAKIVPKI